VAGTARTTQVRARQRARTRLADTLAAQREREKANEDDLAAFFALDDQITSAAAARDAALADVARTHDAATAHAHQGQQNCVHQLHNRGLKVDDIAALTGWSTTAIRKALRARPTTTTTTNTTNTNTTNDDTGDGDVVEATVTDAVAEGSVA
jgi:DNA-directed RNA polymerase specialized sigma24 family protein